MRKIQEDLLAAQKLKEQEELAKKADEEHRKQ